MAGKLDYPREGNWKLPKGELHSGARGGHLSFLPSCGINE